jgi:hypothetical protein
MESEEAVPPIVAPLMRVDQRFDGRSRIVLGQIQRALVDQHRQAAVGNRPGVLDQSGDDARLSGFNGRDRLLVDLGLRSDYGCAGAERASREKNSSVDFHSVPHVVGVLITAPLTLSGRREKSQVHLSILKEGIMLALWQDLRYSLRSLRKHALLSTVVIATLTLGVGFSAGIFTLIKAIYLRAKIDKDHDSFAQVHSVYTQDPTRPGRPGGTTLEDYLAFRERAKSLGRLAAHAGIEAPLGNDDPAETRAQLVTSNFFSLYDVERPIIGRLLEPEDCSEARPVVVLSDRLWRDRFASDPQHIGKVIHFNGQPVTVVGVAPEFSGGGNQVKAWFPYTLETYMKLGANLLKPGEAAWLNVQGRLNPGFTREEAAAELRLLASQQDRLHPGRNSTHIVTDGSWVQTPGLRNRMIWIVALIIGVLTI